MALDYKQSADLRTNVVFMGRIGTAALQWASYIMGNNSMDANSPIARRQLAYAQDVYNNPVIKAQQLQPGVVQDGAVQGADIDPQTGDSTLPDADLQRAVEGVINKII